MLRAGGVPSPATYLTSQPDELAPLLETGPLIVKPYKGTDGHGIRVIKNAAELADVSRGKEPVFAQRYHQPQGRDRSMFSTGGQHFRWKKAIPPRTHAQ